MSDETSKTRAIRGAFFEEQYLSGRVIDIGCGPDPIVPHAEPFDLEHGDAQEIDKVRPKCAYDTVYSSHCLEHMRNVPRALDGWWALVKDNGFFILVVPDEDLYEQGGWPSIFNYDHRATFRMGKESTWSPVSYDILDLVRSLKGAEIVSCERHDHGYDHEKMKKRISKKDRAVFRLKRLSNGAFRRLGAIGATASTAADKVFAALGSPVDQTFEGALAQIQIIARKRASSDVTAID